MPRVSCRDVLTGRPRLLVLNQYYWPGVEATANLLTDLCEGLTDEYDVTVVTGSLREIELPREERRNGVRIIRVRSTAYDRASLWRRAVNYFSYLGLVVVRALGAARPDVVLCMTDPPMVGDVGLVLARRYRVPLVVISEDVFPEIAVQLKRLENPVVINLLERMTRFYLRRADRVVAIGETMERRLRDKGAPGERIGRDPELGRHRGAHAAAARQRVGAGERSRRAHRRHAFGQRRPRAGSRQSHPGDDPRARPRAPCGR